MLIYIPTYVLYSPFTENDAELIVHTKKKRRRVIVESDSDSDNNENSSLKTNKLQKKAKVLYDSEPSDDDGSADPSQSGTDLKSFSFTKTNGEPSTPNKKDALCENKRPSVNLNASFIAPAASESNWIHNKLEFLKSHKIRDINKNRPDHPDYDCRTLHVPDDFLNKQTPAMRQWWVLKSKHFDSVLFFKVRVSF